MNRQKKRQIIRDLANGKYDGLLSKETQKVLAFLIGNANDKGEITIVNDGIVELNTNDR